MTRNEFLTGLANELKKNGITDVSDILSEYDEHFAFKLADGFSEEEIAAKLGSPASLAAQFERARDTQASGGRKAFAVTGLGFASIFVGAFYALLFAWEAILGAFSIVCASVAACLFAAKSPWALIPPMPYGCGVLFGLTLVAMAVLSAVGCFYFAAFLRQMMRSCSRFYHNTLAQASGGASLPSLPIHPQLSAKANRRMRSVALIAIALFAATFVLGLIVATVTSGSFEFWHAWGWFGATAVQ